MQAALLQVGGHFEVTEVPDPEPEPDQVLVRVVACGVCGSDLHMRRGGLYRPGTILGHEMGGIVEDFGLAVDPKTVGLSRGDHVAVIPGDVDAPLTTAMGLGLRPGGFAEYVTVWPSQLVTLPHDVPPHVGALAEPLAVGLHGVDVSGVTPDASAAVLGGGSVGVMTALALRSRGVNDFVVSEPSRERRSILDRLDLPHCSPEEVMAHTGGGGFGDHGPHVVFDCTGVGPVLQQAVDLVRRQGTVVLLGIDERPATVLPTVWVVKEVTVRSALAYGGSFPRAVRAVVERSIPVDVLSVDRRPLSDVESTFDLLDSAAAPPKILLQP